MFLRALVAPLYLLATNVLAVGAALGLTTLVFQDLLGADGLVFYVPFAAAVLLVALGSDYNIFSVGYIWEQARAPAAARGARGGRAPLDPGDQRRRGHAGGQLRAGRADPARLVPATRLRARPSGC